MRFEIRAGGAILILLGLAILSGVVFALGLAAGYQMARQSNPETPQVASVYSLPAASPASDTAAAKSFAQKPSEEKSSDDDIASDTAPPATAPAIHKTTEKPSTASNANTLSIDHGAGPVTPPPRTASAPVIAPPRTVSAPAPVNPATANAAIDEPLPPPHYVEKYASASSGASSGRHKPFNIQIDAVMDHTNADQMASRLQKLGYHAYLVPTDIGGQTWWRVRVGPYQSEDDASAAEQELRSRYRDTYTEQ